MVVSIIIEDTNQQEKTTAVDSTSIINTNSNSNNKNYVDNNISTNKKIDSTSNNDIDINTPDKASNPFLMLLLKTLRYRKLFLKSLKRIVETGNLKSRYLQAI